MLLALSVCVYPNQDALSDELNDTSHVKTFPTVGAHVLLLSLSLHGGSFLGFSIFWLLSCHIALFTLARE